MFELGFIPLIDNPTRVCKNSATIIDNVFTNCIFDNTLKKFIIKIDNSDHFPIIFTVQTGKNKIIKDCNIAYNKREFHEAKKHGFQAIAISSPLAACKT